MQIFAFCIILSFAIAFAILTHFQLQDIENDIREMELQHLREAKQN